MSYKSTRKKMEKNKRTKKLDTKYVKFTKKGEEILGVLVSTNEVTPEDGTSSYRQYIFDTDEGPIKCAFGAAFDKSTFPLLAKGILYAIEYDGKESIGKGRSVNKFTVTEFGTVTESAEAVETVK